MNHINKLFQEYSMIDSPDLSPGSSTRGTNRTNRTRSYEGKCESVLFGFQPFTGIVPREHNNKNYLRLVTENHTILLSNSSR